MEKVSEELLWRSVGSAWPYREVPDSSELQEVELRRAEWSPVVELATGDSTHVSLKAAHL